MRLFKIDLKRVPENRAAKKVSPRHGNSFERWRLQAPSPLQGEALLEPLQTPQSSLQRWRLQGPWKPFTWSVFKPLSYPFWRSLESQLVEIAVWVWKYDARTQRSREAMDVYECFSALGLLSFLGLVLTRCDIFVRLFWLTASQDLADFTTMIYKYSAKSVLFVLSAPVYVQFISKQH